MLKSLFNEVAGLQSTALSKKILRQRCFSCEFFLRTSFFFEHLQANASGRAQGFTKNGPYSNSYNDFCNACLLSKRVRICFLRAIYSRFMEFLIESFNKAFVCS